VEEVTSHYTVTRIYKVILLVFLQFLLIVRKCENYNIARNRPINAFDMNICKLVCVRRVHRGYCFYQSTCCEVSGTASIFGVKQVILNMETACSSEMLVPIHQITRYHIPVDPKLRSI
jgi:hypothetical protein